MFNMLPPRLHLWTFGPQPHILEAVQAAPLSPDDPATTPHILGPLSVRLHAGIWFSWAYAQPLSHKKVCHTVAGLGN